MLDDVSRGLFEHVNHATFFFPFFFFRAGRVIGHFLPCLNLKRSNSPLPSHTTCTLPFPVPFRIGEVCFPISSSPPSRIRHPLDPPPGSCYFWFRISTGSPPAVMFRTPSIRKFFFASFPPLYPGRWNVWSSVYPLKSSPPVPTLSVMSPFFFPR